MEHVHFMKKEYIYLKTQKPLHIFTYPQTKTSKSEENVIPIIWKKEKREK